MGGTEKSRRNLLKATSLVAASQALPNQWTKPVVDAVMLPAHGQTSPFTIACEISRGAEGLTPQVVGGTFEIDTTIQITEPGVADGDTANVRHQVIAAGYDETFPGTVNEVAPNFFIGDRSRFLCLPV